MRFGRAGRDNADTLVLELDRHHEHQPGQLIESDDGITRFVVARRIDQYRQLIREYCGRILEADATRTPRTGRLVGVPNEIVATDTVLFVRAL